MVLILRKKYFRVSIQPKGVLTGGSRILSPPVGGWFRSDLTKNRLVCRWLRRRVIYPYRGY